MDETTTSITSPIIQSSFDTAGNSTGLGYHPALNNQSIAPPLPGIEPGSPAL